jgi:hypothetical protein
MIKYPSTEQLRNIVRHVKTHHDYKGKDENGDPIYRHDSPYPTLEFTGTVKIHGTNASIVGYKDGRIVYQSRENVLSLTQDNAGFFLYMKSIEDKVKDLLDYPEMKDHIAVYGEWCGGNIQRGVAVTGLPKMFVIFALKIDGEFYNFIETPETKKIWAEKWNPLNIWHINQFKTYKISIDFNYPELVQNKLIEMTEEVEHQCPVGFHFGNEGIGEGIVWKCDTDPGLFFKVKGEKHSVSKVTKLASVDVPLLESMREFVELAVQEGRLLQGIDKVVEMGKDLTEKSTGDFLRWVITDVMKEEEDTIVKNGWDPKKLNPIISKFAREWYFEYIKNTIYEKA